MFKFSIIAITFSLSFLMNQVNAVVCQLDLFNNGQITSVNLPFHYYERQPGDNFTMIHQGGYKVYDIANSQGEVAVIGPVRPCIAVAVTDGEKVVVFHKHSSNSLDHMSEIIQAHLNLADTTNLYGRIFTTRDDLEWNTWNNGIRSLMHARKTHTDAVRDIKNKLADLGFDRTNVPATLYNLRDARGNLHYEDYALGNFEHAETTPCLCLHDLFDEKDGKRNLKFFSTDFVREDVFGYKGTMISQAELAGKQMGGAAPTTRQRLANTPDRVIPFDAIPQLYHQQTGLSDGFKFQRGVVQRFMDSQNGEYYFRHFGKNQSDLFRLSYEDFFNGTSGGYNSLEFFEIDGNL